MRRRRLLILATSGATETEAEAGAKFGDFTIGFTVGASLTGIAAAIYAVHKYQSTKTND